MTENTTAGRPRVLVGVDGSAPARAALEFAASEARLRDAVLVAVMAVEMPDYAWIDPYVVRVPENGTLERAREKLDRLLASVDTEGLVLDPVVVSTEGLTVLGSRVVLAPPPVRQERSVRRLPD